MDFKVSVVAQGNISFAQDYRIVLEINDTSFLSEESYSTTDKAEYAASMLRASMEKVFGKEKRG